MKRGANTEENQRKVNRFRTIRVRKTAYSATNQKNEKSETIKSEHEIVEHIRELWASLTTKSIMIQR